MSYPVRFERVASADDAKAAPTDELLWVVPGGSSTWAGIVARSVVPENAETLDFCFNWEGEEKSCGVHPVRPNPGAKLVTLKLEDAGPRANRFWGRHLELKVQCDGKLVGTADLLVIPRAQAHVAWGLLGLFVLLAAVRALALAAMLEKSGADLLVLALGGVTAAAWIVGKLKDVFAWFSRVEAPLFGRFSPRLGWALVLSALVFLPFMLITQRFAVLTNKTQASTVLDLGVTIPSSETVVVWAAPVAPKQSKLRLAAGPRPPGVWDWLLHLVFAPRDYDVLCAPIVLATEATRLVADASPGAKVDGENVIADHDEACVTKPFRALLHGLPGLVAKDDRTRGTLISRPWPETVKDRGASFTINPLVSSTAPTQTKTPTPTLWVRSLRPSSSIEGIEWVAGNEPGKSIPIPWPASSWSFESMSELSGEAMGKLDAEGCGGAPAVTILPWTSDVPRLMKLSTEAGGAVSTWTALRHVQALLACGRGERLEIGLEGASEPKQAGLTLPSALGVQSVQINVNLRTMGTVQCPIGDVWLGAMRNASGCEAAERQPVTPSSQWYEREEPPVAWTSPWFCVPAHVERVPVRMSRRGAITDGMATRVQGEWIFKRTCPPTGKYVVCACMLGDKRIDAKDVPTTCAHGCDRTDRKFPGCDEATQCIP